MEKDTTYDTTITPATPKVGHTTLKTKTKQNDKTQHKTKHYYYYYYYIYHKHTEREHINLDFLIFLLISAPPPPAHPSPSVPTTAATPPGTKVDLSFCQQLPGETDVCCECQHSREGNGGGLGEYIGMYWGG